MVKVDSSWLDALTPRTPHAGPGFFDWGPSTMESMIVNSGKADEASIDTTYNQGTPTKTWNREVFVGGGNRSTFLESIIASQVVDGVSHYGSHKAYNTTGSTNS